MIFFKEMLSLDLDIGFLEIVSFIVYCYLILILYLELYFDKLI